CRRKRSDEQGHAEGEGELLGEMTHRSSILGRLAAVCADRPTGARRELLSLAARGWGEQGRPRRVRGRSTETGVPPDGCRRSSDTSGGPAAKGGGGTSARDDPP